MSRQTPFSYACHNCRRCCRNKRIQVNPYEVLRLSRFLGVSTASVVDEAVELDEMALRRRPDGTCVFLGEAGCTVHPARPLVCRLYPLGRIVRGGEERWVVLPAAEGSEGVFGNEETIEDYVSGQGALPYMRATDAYHELFEHLVGAGREPDPATNSSNEGPEDSRWLLDVDGALAGTTSEACSSDDSIDELLERHLHLLRTTLAER